MSEPASTDPKERPYRGWVIREVVLMNEPMHVVIDPNGEEHPFHFQVFTRAAELYIDSEILASSPK